VKSRWLRQSSSKWTLLLPLLTLASACGQRTPAAPTTPTTPTAPVNNVTIQLSQEVFNQLGGQATVQVSNSVPGAHWDVAAPDWVRVQPSSGNGDATLLLEVPPWDSLREGKLYVGTSWRVFIQLPEVLNRPLGFEGVTCFKMRAGTGGDACYIVIQLGTTPGSTGVRVFADLSSLGKSNHLQIGQCRGCGQPEFDLSMAIPADLPPGVYRLTFTVLDDQGRTASTSATIEIVPAGG
jgi:hypothetical protein